MGAEPICVGLGLSTFPMETLLNIIMKPNWLCLGIGIGLGISVGHCKSVMRQYSGDRSNGIHSLDE